MFRIAIFVSLVVLRAGTAMAMPVPLSQQTQSAKRVLAITILGEDDNCRSKRCLADWRGMSWVLAKRWRMRARTRPNERFEDTIRLFSSIWKVDDERARKLRSLEWGDGADNTWGKRWVMAQKFVDHWFAGSVPDPCPRALNWGMSSDSPAGPWKPIKCGSTRNTFWAINRR